MSIVEQVKQAEQLAAQQKDQAQAKAEKLYVDSQREAMLETEKIIGQARGKCDEIAAAIKQQTQTGIQQTEQKAEEEIAQIRAAAQKNRTVTVKWLAESV